MTFQDDDYRLSRNVCNYPSTMRNITEERRFIYTAAEASNPAEQWKRTVYFSCFVYSLSIPTGRSWSFHPLDHGCTSFQKMQEPIQNSRGRKGDMKRVPYCGTPQILSSTVQTLVVTATMRMGFVYPCTRTTDLWEAEIRIFHNSAKFLPRATLSKNMSGTS